MKALAFCMIAGALVGIALYYSGVLPAIDLAPLAALGATITATISAGFSQFMAVWNTIPETIRGLIIAGVPTLFMLFFAWSKSRAMAQLQQTQQQASQAITQINGEKNEAEALLSGSSKQILDLQDKITQLEQRTPDVSSYLTQIQQKNTEIQKLQQDMNNMERTYQNLVDELKQREKIVVK